MRGGRKPLIVEERSSSAEVSAGAELELIATPWEEAVAGVRDAKRKR
jgi:hypothetical protein